MRTPFLTQTLVGTVTSGVQWSAAGPPRVAHLTLDTPTHGVVEVHAISVPTGVGPGVRLACRGVLTRNRFPDPTQVLRAAVAHHAPQGPASLAPGELLPTPGERIAESIQRAQTAQKAQGSGDAALTLAALYARLAQRQAALEARLTALEARVAACERALASSHPGTGGAPEKESFHVDNIDPADPAGDAYPGRADTLGRPAR
ncbi:MAG: hypothetical protein NVSMB65_14560 [Chloroflexota bacterium]